MSSYEQYCRKAKQELLPQRAARLELAASRLSASRSPQPVLDAVAAVRRLLEDGALARCSEVARLNRFLTSFFQSEIEMTRLVRLIRPSSSSFISVRLTWTGVSATASASCSCVIGNS